MKVTLLTVVTLAAVATIAGAADPECIYRKLRGLNSHWPNPSSCSSYYRCSTKNVVRAIHCPIGKEYNPKTGKCSTAGRGLCKLSLTAPLAEAGNICSNEVNGAYLPDPDYCQQFFICNEQLAYSQHCDAGSHFDIQTNACVPDTETTCWQNLCLNRANGAMLPSNTSCASYYTCQNKETAVMRCASGSYYDSSKSECVEDVNNSQCWENFCIGKQDGLAIADPDDCSGFYICSSEKAVLQECPSGSYFSENKNCVPGTCPDKECTTPAPCTEGQVENDDEDVCYQYKKCVDGAWQVQNCPVGSLFDADTLTCVDDKDNICPQCSQGCADGSSEGEQVADATNCRLFFTCQNGELVPGDCGSGNYFNAESKECQEDTSNCCNDNSPSVCAEGEKSVDAENCNQYFECVDDSWQSRTCDAGNFFNQQSLTCVPDTDNECPQCSAPSGQDCTDGTKDGQNTLDPQNCRLYFTCQNGQLVPGDCEAGNFFDNSIKQCCEDKDNICTDNAGTCVDDELQADEENCNQYLQCENGCWQTKSCPDGSSFDKVLKTCVVPTDAPTAAPTEPTELAPLAGGACNSTAAAIAADNCWKYLACINGIWMEESCTAGYYFDSSSGICRKDSRNVCPENRRVKTSLRSRRSAGCSNGMAEGTMMASTTECDMYVLCQNGQLSEGTCGRGNIFSPSQGVCVRDTDATCWICNNKPNGHLMMDKTNCSSYFSCYDGLAVAKECGPGQRFDGGGCVIDVTGQCLNPCSCAGGNVNVAHPICSKYFKCESGVPTVMDCPLNQAFDAATGACANDVACSALQCATATDGTPIPDNTDSTRFYLCYNHMPIIRSCPANSAFDTTFSICLPVPSAACDQTQCKTSTVDQSYPSNDDDNSTFCLCQSNGGYLKSCEDGMTFDPVQKACTFTGPCNPLSCVNAQDNTVDVNYEDDDSFCLCRAEQPVSVPCPIGYTFDAELRKCLPKTFPDPRCCSSHCTGSSEGYTFPARGTDTGFCVCLGDQISFNECPIGKTYDDNWGSCLYPQPNIECAVNDCDATQCATLSEYQAYPANSSAGFCYCQQDCPIYRTCENDYQFNENLGACLPGGVWNCDATMCATVADRLPFEADNGNSGFCYCEGGQVNYANCPFGRKFDLEYRACVVVPAPCAVCNSQQCAGQPDNTYFGALNSTAGFCVCVEEQPVYQACMDDMLWNADLQICLPVVAAVNTHAEACDSTQCKNRSAETTFAAKDLLDGFCACEANGIATFKSCGAYHVYDKILNFCVIDACDPTLCRIRTKFDTFAARNTTRGFCACDAVPTYYHCSAGHVFDADLGICVHEVTSVAAACDPRECDKYAKFETFAAKNAPEGFCSCDGAERIATFHNCGDGKLYDRVLGVCMDVEHKVQKRSVEPEEKLLCEVNAKRSVPANCSQYEICLDGNWRRRSCSEERYYNPEQQRCLEPRDDMVCSYAKVPGLPACNATNELETIPSRVVGKGSCQQYFRCAAGKWRLRGCPRRHYYAKSLATCLAMPEFEGDDFCTWLNSSESRPMEGCQHLTVRPYVMGCDRFLMCMENVWWIQQCPLGMYFSQEANYCLPNDANQCSLEASNATHCEEGQERPLATSCRSYEECSNGVWLAKTCAKTEQFEPQLGCVPNDGNCQGSGLRRSCQPGQLLSLTRPAANCSQFFYYCDADEWHLSSCLRGNSFNRQLNKCQALDKCRTSVKALPASSCSGKPDGLSVADAEDCTRFYLCLQEQLAVPQRCASGSFFDSLLGYCRPNDGSCQQLELICANRTQGALVPHAENCQAYYNCSSLSSNSSEVAAHLAYCPAGQYFNKSLAQCKPDQGQCQQQALFDQQASLGLCLERSHGSRLPHPLYCNQYYACVHGLAILAECEDRWRFNATLSRCEPEPSQVEDAVLPACQRGQLAPAVNSSVLFSCEHLQDGSYVPDAGDCTKYYICAGGVAMMQRCGSGAYFDAEQLLCTQDDGSCPYVVNGSLVNATSAAITNKGKPPSPLLCEGKHGQLLPDLSNCNNFYICVSNKLRWERCYAGYFFNATLQQCQSIELATEEEQDVLLKTQELRNHTMEVELSEAQLPRNCTDAPTDVARLCEVIGAGASTAEPGDCRRYISCDADEPVSQRCRNGESYDSLLGICRQNDGTCLMENGERVGVCNGKHGQLARDTHNCRGYFVCLHGQKIEAECETGQFFNKANNVCEADVLLQCSPHTNEAEE